MDRLWTVQLTVTAQSDYREILTWTLASFGANQADVYDETLLVALEDLTAGPDQVGVKRRSDIGADICTLHIARKGRKGRHFLMFRVGKEQHSLDVLRILHERMDLVRHIVQDDLH